MLTVISSAASVRASPRLSDTIPPLLAEYTTEPPKPPVSQPCDVKLMIRPPRAAPGAARGDGAVEEERGLDVDVELEVPVLLSDLVDRGAAPQHRGQVDEHVEAPETLDHRLSSSLRCQVGQVGADRQMPLGSLQAATASSHAARRRPRRQPARQRTRTPGRPRLPMPPAPPVTMTPRSSNPRLQLIRARGSGRCSRSRAPSRARAARTAQIPSPSCGRLAIRPTRSGRGRAKAPRRSRRAGSTRAGALRPAAPRGGPSPRRTVRHRRDAAPLGRPARPRRVEVADVDRAADHQVAAPPRPRIALTGADRGPRPVAHVAHRAAIVVPPARLLEPADVDPRPAARTRSPRRASTPGWRRRQQEVGATGLARRRKRSASSRGLRASHLELHPRQPHLAQLGDLGRRVGVRRVVAADRDHRQAER